jgi:hypothetical protein
MKTIAYLVALAALLCDDACGALVLYEPFGYSNFGAPVTENTPENWATNIGTQPNDATVVPGSLSSAGLVPSVGNSLVTGGNGLGVRRLFNSTVTSGTLYFSVLFKMNTIGTGWNAPNASIGALTETNNTGFKVSVLVNRNFDNTGYVFGVQKGGTGSTPSFDVTSYFEGSTVLLVGNYTFDPDNPDTISLWINPDSSTFGLPLPPLPTLTTNTGTESIGLDRFNFRQNVATGSNSLPEAMQWDELRIGDSWAEVTPIPEPSTAALFCLAAAGLARRRISARNA